MASATAIDTRALLRTHPVIRRMALEATVEPPEKLAARSGFYDAAAVVFSHRCELGDFSCPPHKLGDPGSAVLELVPAFAEARAAVEFSGREPTAPAILQEYVYRGGEL